MKLCKSSWNTVHMDFLEWKCIHSITYRSSWWHHQMETFSALLAFCEGNPLVTRGFPSQRQWRGAFMFSLICLNKRLSKQSRRLWVRTPLHSLWRNCNVQLTTDSNYKCVSISYFIHNGICFITTAAENRHLYIYPLKSDSNNGFKIYRAEVLTAEYCSGDCH